MDIRITPNLTIPGGEVHYVTARSSGPGGQNVNKVATAIHLRFDVQNSAAVPDKIKHRLRNLSDHRITDDGTIIIKSQAYRSQERNRQAALTRLSELISSVMREPKRRIKTKPSKKAKQKRLDSKTRRGALKQTRRMPTDD